MLSETDNRLCRLPKHVKAYHTWLHQDLQLPHLVILLGVLAVPVIAGELRACRGSAEQLARLLTHRGCRAGGHMLAGLAVDEREQTRARATAASAAAAAAAAAATSTTTATTAAAAACRVMAQTGL